MRLWEHVISGDSGAALTVSVPYIETRLSKSRDVQGLSSWYRYESDSQMRRIFYGSYVSQLRLDQCKATYRTSFNDLMKSALLFATALSLAERLCCGYWLVASLARPYCDL